MYLLNSSTLTLSLTHDLRIRRPSSSRSISPSCLPPPSKKVNAKSCQCPNPILRRCATGLCWRYASTGSLGLGPCANSLNQEALRNFTPFQCLVVSGASAMQLHHWLRLSFFFAFPICFRNLWRMSRIRRIFPQCNTIVLSHLQGGL